MCRILIPVKEIIGAMITGGVLVRGCYSANLRWWYSGGDRRGTFVGTTQNKIMNREINEITELALANLLDVIPLISNIGERVDPIILRIYERNSAVLEQN